MKYKLINSVIKTETICDKVTIDGFDYYVSDITYVNGGDIFYNTFSKKIESSNITQQAYWINKVITTNNPNIDIPKVVDEVEELAEKFIGCKYEDVEDSIDQIGYDSFKRGYSKSQETHPFSEENMKSFLKFSIEYRRYNDLAGLSKSADELLQLWKEQQPKIVYYA